MILTNLFVLVEQFEPTFRDCSFLNERMRCLKNVEHHKFNILFFLLFITFAFFLPTFVRTVSAVQTAYISEDPVRISARIGEFYLNLSGFASPFASIILTSNGVFYRTTVADENGFWSIQDILINKNFSSFCLQHIDYKNIGESKTCFTIPPATGDIVKQDIFLPPTIGLQRSQIMAGGNAVIFGYTMPGASVTIHLHNGKSYTVTADENGYYELTIKNLPAGTYELYATANYQGKPSESPSSTLRLIALSWWQQILLWIKQFITWLWTGLTGFGLGPLWLVIPLIPLIIFLILKIWPEKFTSIYNNRIFSLLYPREKKLHHAWFVGY